VPVIICYYWVHRLGLLGRKRY